MVGPASHWWSPHLAFSILLWGRHGSAVILWSATVSVLLAEWAMGLLQDSKVQSLTATTGTWFETAQLRPEPANFWINETAERED